MLQSLEANLQSSGKECGMFWIRIGAVLMFLGVALGAFGAHALRGRLAEDMLAVFETGIRYHFYHALGLFVVAWLSESHPSGWVNGAGWCFLVGIVIFSGSLYILSMSGVRWWGAVTPIGGVAFLAGWLALTMATIRSAVG
jgi:uncharacterized membrane protein YgdD (TMEM256/DUF423 family)